MILWQPVTKMRNVSRTGSCYLTVDGVVSGFQRMIKIVNRDEITLQVIQEIYDNEGRLIERHQKYPVDTGHQKLVDEE